MSTISLPFEDQIRHFYVIDAIASETTISTFISGASNGEGQIFTTDGDAFTYANAPADGGDFYIAKKNTKGGISKSDFITPADITYLKGTAPRAKTGKTQIFTLTGAPTPATDHDYFIDLKINYGNSEENFINFYGSARAVTGDTTTTLLARLGKSLAENLANSVNTNTNDVSLDTIVTGTTAKKNKYFTISVAGSVLTIAEKDWILDDYVPGLRTHDQLMWNAEIKGTDAAVANTTKTFTAPVFATGQGYQIMEMERYFVGHRAEATELLDSTLGFRRPLDSVVTADYYVLDLKYFDISRDSSKRANKMLTIVSEDELVIDALGFAIEAQMGFTEGTKWVELDADADGADNAA